jgi:hypothetical protein
MIARTNKNNENMRNGLEEERKKTKLNVIWRGMVKDKVVLCLIN